MTKFKLARAFRLRPQASVGLTGDVSLTATRFTLSGPTSGTTGSPATFTVTPDGALASTVVVTISAPGATLSVSTLTFNQGSSAAQTFTVTRSTNGTTSVSITNNGGLSIVGSPISHTTAGAATAVALSGPTSGNVGQASAAFTVAANGSLVSNVIVTPSDNGGGGTFTPSTVTLTSTNTSGTFTYTAASAGAKSISITNNGGLTNTGTPISYTASTSTLSTTFAITSAAAGTGVARPFTFGHAFRQGDITDGRYVTTADALEFQADVRNKWPDGSVKFAVLSGRATVSQNVKKTLTLATTATAPGGTNLTESAFIAALGANNVTVSFTSVRDHNNSTLGSGTLSANLSTALGVSKTTWSNSTSAGRVRSILGPVMSEHHYFVPTTDAHIAVWFYCRHYSDSSIEVETVVENGWRGKASPGERRYTVSVTVAGSTVYGPAALTHYARTRWSRVDWVGTDHTMTPEHNVAYLRSTKLVPNYGYRNPSSAAWTGLASAINPTPFALGNWRADMSATGPQDPIGIIPKWEALYCTTGDSRAYLATVSNHRGSGRWSIHYRDETTGRIPSYGAYPDITYTSGWGDEVSAAGGSNGTWDHAHHPSTGFLPYMLTGRWPALESMQFTAAFSFFDTVPHSGGGSLGRTYSTLTKVVPTGNSPNTERGAAWAWRSIGQVATLSPVYLMGSAAPAADALMQQMNRESVADTATYHNGKFITGTFEGGAHVNTIGWMGQYGNVNGPGFGGIYNDGQNGPLFSSTGHWWGVSWQNDFQTYTLGYLSDLGIEGLTATNLIASRDHMYKGLLGRMRTEPVFNWRRSVNLGRPYLKNFSEADAPVFMTPTESYAAYKAFFSLPTLSANLWETIKEHSENGNTDILTGSSSDFSEGYGAGVTMAISYAVDHAYPGANDAWRKFKTSPSYTPQAHGADDKPQFSHVPRFTVPYSLPSAGQTLGISGSNFQGLRPSGWDTFAWRYSLLSGCYGGGTFVDSYSPAGAYVLAGTGGHNTAEMVGAMVFDFTTGTWARLDPNGTGTTYYRSGQGYQLSDTSGSPYYEINGSGGIPAPPHPYQTLCYLPPAYGGGPKGSVVYVTRSAITGDSHSSPATHRFDLSTQAWSRFSALCPSTPAHETSALWDEGRGRFWLAPWTSNGSDYRYLDVSGATPTWQSAGVPSAPGAAQALRVFLHKGWIIRLGNSGTMFAFNPDAPSSGWQQLTVSGGGLLPLGDLNEQYNTFAQFSNGKFYSMRNTGGSSILRLTPPAGTPTSGTWTVDSVAISPAVPGTPTDAGSRDHYTRLFYVPMIDRLAWITGDDSTTNPHVYLIHPGA